ncbi:MAG: hypothetical protein ACW98Y_08595, partial [Candidatus Thorarchaeota archaeon]
MRVRLGITLVMVLFLVGMLSNPLLPIHSSLEDDSMNHQHNLTPQLQFDTPNYIISEDQKSGTIDPLAIEQRGSVSTGNVTVRNDMTLNVEDTLSIDTTHDWVGSVASAEVSELEKLYALNGTFDEGNAGTNLFPNGTVEYHPLGWVANSTDTAAYPDDKQIAAYDNSSRNYVLVESYGGKVGQSEYAHATGNQIVWSQTVQNSPHTEDFEFSFDYYYLRGPITGPGGDPLTGNCSLALLIDGVNVWNISLLLLSQRGIWYSTGNIPIHISGAPSSFTFEIGLVINQQMKLDYKTADYDGDTYVDGIEHSAYITAYMDDISFIASTPPTPESVELTLNAGAGSSAVSGTSGSGTAEVSNSSYWDSDILDISFTSNTTISFTYDVSLLSHRFSNSTWTNEISSEGTAYQIECGNISQVESFTYIGSAVEYTNNSMTFNFPFDWYNITVYDPFLTNATADCEVNPNNVTIPDSLFSRLGWWRFVADTENYAKDMQTQISGPSTSDWTNESVFRSTNYSRVTLEIGTGLQAPSSLSNVDVSWYMPNDTLWSSETINSMSGNTINSSSLTLGSDNTTAGLWKVILFWENGTELAFEMMEFEIHHQAQLIAENVLVETDEGTVITNMVRYVDIETSEYIMDVGTDIVANWSASTITFLRNPVHNWWEANFDTTLVGGGIFSVRVNASGSFYDSAFTVFTVHVILTDNVLTLSQTTAETDLKVNYTAEFTYKDKYGTGIEVANLNVSYTGPSNGLIWYEHEDLGLGSYRMNFYANVSGSYAITLTAWKSYYESADDILFLLVGEYGSQISSPNGTAAAVNFGESYRYVLLFENTSSYGLSGANVSIVNMVPSTGLTNGSIIDKGNGYYSVILTPDQTGVFTLLFEAEIQNHETQFISFTLTSTVIGTQLTVDASADLIAVGDPLYVTLNYTTELGAGIENANISIVTPPSGLTIPPIVELGGGLYMYTITPTTGGAYQLRFKANMTNHLDATAAYSFLVGLYTSVLTSHNGTSGSISLGQSFSLVIEFENETGYGLSGAYVDILSIAPAVGLNNDSLTDHGNGNYSIVFTPISIGIYTIQIEVSLTQYETQLMFFTLTSPVIATQLTMEASSGLVAVGDPLYITLNYTNDQGIGLEGADVSIVDPPVGLSITPFVELGGGLYKYTITPTAGGAYQLRFNANISNHLESTAAYSFLVGLYPSVLTSHNGTSGSVALGQSYNLLIEFTNETGYGLSGANIDIISISPAVGLNNESINDHGNGNYTLVFTSTSTGIYTIEIQISLTQYESQLMFFTITSPVIGSFLTIEASSEIVAIGDDCIITFTYSNETSDGISGATIA